MSSKMPSAARWRCGNAAAYLQIFTIAHITQYLITTFILINIDYFFYTKYIYIGVPVVRHWEAPRTGAPPEKEQDVKAWSENAPRTWVLALTAVASFMVALDTLVVATALSTIRRDLSASIAALQTAP